MLGAAVLRDSGAFHEILRPHSDWIFATAPLPETLPDPPSLRRHGFMFAEGRDRVQSSLEAHNTRGTCLSLSDVAALSGDFCFIQVAPDGSAIAARSCAGVVPLYYATRPDRLLIATQLGWIARLLDDVELDAVTHAGRLSGFSNLVYGRSLLKDVATLRCGTALELRAGEQPRVASYWDRPAADAPLARTNARKKLEYAEEIRTLVTENLRANLDPQGRNLLSLSGGIDSAIVATVTRRHTPHTFRTHTWLPRDAGSRALEERYILPLVEELSLPWAWDEQLSPQEQLQLRRTRAPHALLHCTQDDFCLFAREVAQNDTRVFFNGHFADLLFDSRGQQTEDWLRLARLSSLLVGPRPPGQPARLLARWLWYRMIPKRSPRNAPTLWSGLSADAVEQFNDWYASDIANRAPDARAEPLFLRGLHRRLCALTHLDAYWESASASGARCAFPFLSRELVELSYRIHPSFHLPGPKELLRIGFAGIVSGRSLNRPDKGLRPTRRRSADWVKLSADQVLAGQALGLMSYRQPVGMPLPMRAADALRLTRVVGTVRELCGMRHS